MVHVAIADVTGLICLTSESHLTDTALGSVSIQLSLRFPHADGLVHIECVDSLANHQDVRGIGIIAHTVPAGIDRSIVGTQGDDLALVVRSVERGVPLELTCHVMGGNLNIDTFVLYFTEVTPDRCETAGTSHRHLIEQILGGLGVPVERELNPVVDQAQVDGYVGRVGLLPSKVAIAK